MRTRTTWQSLKSKRRRRKPSVSKFKKSECGKKRPRLSAGPSLPKLNACVLKLKRLRRKLAAKLLKKKNVLGRSRKVRSSTECESWKPPAPD